MEGIKKEDNRDYLLFDQCFMIVESVYLFSSETVSFFLPVALLLDNTFLPFLVDILSLKPCLFLRFLTDGWNVLFIIF